MSRRLQQLWLALEKVPDLAGVLGEWRALLASEHAVVARFLLPTQRIARSVRCTVPGRTCIHEIRPWKRQYLSVCPDGCDSVTLSKDEVIIHRVDVPLLACEVADAIGLEAVPAERLSQPSGVWRIGDYVPLAGYRFPFYLAFTGESDAMRSTVDGLAARREPFVLAAPSRSAFNQATADLITRAKSCLLALHELIGQSNGRLCLLDGHNCDGTFAELRAANMPQPKPDDGMVTFPTPADARWEDVSIRFIDSHSVHVTVKSASGTYHFAQVGMANMKNAKPTVQWLLLETFAEGHGRLDWRNSKASRKNQKRKENLAADLQRFFRINGDPFALEGDGWRARFTVSVRE